MNENDRWVKYNTIEGQEYRNLITPSRKQIKQWDKITRLDNRLDNRLQLGNEFELHEGIELGEMGEFDDRIDEIDQEYGIFLKKYPNYRETVYIDKLRAQNYNTLRKHVYLDYTGGGIYSDTQIREHQNILINNVFGNPHSANPTSQYSTELVEDTRSYVLKFFNADPSKYEVIFTANASNALKLVGESFPFKNGRLVLTSDNHNSVNGIREFAKSKGATVTYIPVLRPDMRIDQVKLKYELSHPASGYNLFAYPAQSNFTSVIHSFKWIQYAQNHGWHILLDASAYVPTNRLDLTEISPCFVALSFYKMFGYPTGIGALIAKKTALDKLRSNRPWFAGGTINMVSVQTKRHILTEGSAAFEDGTINYLDIPAVKIGLKYISHIGYDLIHTRVSILTSWLLDNILSMKHSTGVYLVSLYGPRTMNKRGGAVTVNFYDSKSVLIHHSIVEKRANKFNISIRTGCMCNPGTVEIALNLSPHSLDKYFTRERTPNNKLPGVVRISVGLMSNFHDIQLFLKFCRKFLQ